MISPLHLLVLAWPWLTLLAQRPLSRRLALRSAFSHLVLTALLWARGSAAGLDELSLWLLPYCSLVYLVLFLFIPRGERNPLLSRALLASQGLDLLFLSSQTPWQMALLWPLTHGPLYLELRRQPQGPRLCRMLLVFLGPGCVLFAAGALNLGRFWAVPCLVVAIVLRKALFPAHQWFPALLEKAPLGPVLAFTCPQLAACAAARLLTVQADDQTLVGLGTLALFTAVYGACLALGNSSLRGTYAGLFMGQTSLVFAGLQCTGLAGLAGGLAVWISGGLALTGLGACIWALEARRGPIRLDRFHGGYASSPVLAGCFLVLGLACVGFPGTLGFLSQELLLDGTLHVHPHVGVLMALSACLNGITVMRSYFYLFCGTSINYGPTQSIRPRERLALVILLAVLILAGLAPKPFLQSQARIASQILRSRHLSNL